MSAISFLLLIYPYLIYPLILRLLPKDPRDKALHSDSMQPSVALLFCAYNEERSLPAKIENIRQIKQRYPELEVRAYSDYSSDRTLPLLLAASDAIAVHEGFERTGKAAGMRELVNATRADILVFCDANVILAPEAISRIVSYFDDPKIGTVAGTLHYTNPDDGQVAKTGSLYWRLEETIKHLESVTGSTMGADGSLFAIRRSLYPVVPTDLLDDMIASFNPIFSGYRVISANDVHAFERSATDSGDEFRRKRRIACRAFNTHRHLVPQLRTISALNKFKYFSHKYLRWLSPGFLLVGLIFAIAGIAVQLGWHVASISIVAGFVTLAAGLQLNIPLLGVVAEILLSFVAVGLGVIEAIAGRNYQIWNPAKSRE
jgi:cellulose synthase/poly-beta-1,6-N-acetylglucosamine synthase-like glycosyltransferase